MGLQAFLRHRMKSISPEGLGDRETIMDTGSTSGPYTAQIEQSPSSAVDGFALEKETVAAERDSTATRSEYYSQRCEAMMQSRCKFYDDVALEIEFSKSHWSEVSRPEASRQSEDKKALYRDNVKVFQELARGDRRSFGIFNSYSLADGFKLRLGQMIGKGGQAEIFEVVGRPDLVLKVFEGGTSLRDLWQQLPLPVRTKEVRHCIRGAVILKDGRCAFVMNRYWGDLRKLIDQAMQAKNASVGGIQDPPFPYKWIPYHSKCTVHAVDFMSGIAFHMRGLHEKGVFHRDLKASNILLNSSLFDPDLLYSSLYQGLDLALRMVVVADFECSIGVLGTKFWRAPEILLANENREAIMDEQWEKADVYSFGMTCFEITTGRIPFDGELGNTKADRALVIEGKRPKLPSDLDGAVKDLITKCWDPNPILRPKFSEIVEMVEAMKQQCHFRLFDIKDELPPQYHLATVHEVDEYSIALYNAMPDWEIANLASGSVDGLRYGGHTRPEKRNDVGHKLARLHSQIDSMPD